MNLERRIWYPGAHVPVIQRTKDRGPWTTWPAPVPGWDTIEIVRRRTYLPWIAIVVGAYILVLSLLVAFGVAHYPLWVQVCNGACIGLYALAYGAEKLTTGRKRERVQRNPSIHN